MSDPRISRGALRARCQENRKKALQFADALYLMRDDLIRNVPQAGEPLTGLVRQLDVLLEVAHDRCAIIARIALTLIE